MKIAHISDLHLTTLHDVRWPELLNKRILGYMSWRYRRRHVHKFAILQSLMTLLRRENPALLAITGDLTHIGTAGECAQVRAWLDETARSFDIALVPGNHDCYSRADYAKTVGLWRSYFPRQTADDSVPEPGSAINNINNINQEFPTLRAVGDLAVIGVNTACPTAPFMATGKVGAKQRDALATLLRQAGEAGLFRLVLMHHGPVAGTYTSRRQLLDGAEFTDLIKRHGAEMILHGHGHNMVENCIVAGDKRIPVSGVAAATTAVNHTKAKHTKANHTKAKHTKAKHHAAGCKLYEINRERSGWAVHCRVLSFDSDNHHLQQQEEKNYLIQPHQLTGAGAAGFGE